MCFHIHTHTHTQFIYSIQQLFIVSLQHHDNSIFFLYKHMKSHFGKKMFMWNRYVLFSFSLFIQINNSFKFFFCFVWHHAAADTSDAMMIDTSSQTKWRKTVDEHWNIPCVQPSTSNHLHMSEDSEDSFVE